MEHKIDKTEERKQIKQELKERRKNSQDREVLGLLLKDERLHPGTSNIKSYDISINMIPFEDWLDQPIDNSEKSYFLRVDNLHNEGKLGPEMHFHRDGAVSTKHIPHAYYDIVLEYRNKAIEFFAAQVDEAEWKKKMKKRYEDPVMGSFEGAHFRPKCTTCGKRVHLNYKSHRHCCNNWNWKVTFETDGDGNLLAIGNKNYCDGGVFDLSSAVFGCPAKSPGGYPANPND